jgi:hypothetical protein
MGFTSSASHTIKYHPSPGKKPTPETSANVSLYIIYDISYRYDFFNNIT